MENCDIRFKIIYVTIEETTIFNPTAVQALTCLRVCQMVSKRMFEKWYSVIFITLLPPLVPPLQGGKQ